jgi:hypothetical protein
MRTGEVVSTAPASQANQESRRYIHVSNPAVPRSILAVASFVFKAFQSCLVSGRSSWAISVDSADAIPLRLHGTPGILINATMLDGLLPFEILDSLVQM